ncbi:hypothetical protein P691DRAFT_767611 [Macrolepiota fuliginosa MF-IS2]|uniref:Uncharacterized protein n=1 Tax=Macrolepiota fuliginosa MF-IS2 TaxID=1400762 RepID=A0A9P5WZE9_9AGAR|nr:hypothetical protein P691DRAFT_767611 [Macrolepiota fuliginosa MF-IS2]
MKDLAKNTEDCPAASQSIIGIPSNFHFLPSDGFFFTTCQIRGIMSPSSKFNKCALAEFIPDTSMHGELLLSAWVLFSLVLQVTLALFTTSSNAGHDEITVVAQSDATLPGYTTAIFSQVPSLLVLFVLIFPPLDDIIPNSVPENNTHALHGYIQALNYQGKSTIRSAHKFIIFLFIPTFVPLASIWLKWRTTNLPCLQTASKPSTLALEFKGAAESMADVPGIITNNELSLKGSLLELLDDLSYDIDCAWRHSQKLHIHVIDALEW